MSNINKKFYIPEAWPLVVDKTTEFYLDEYGLVLSSSNTTDQGKGDCIGRTFLAAMAYNTEELNYKIGHGIIECFDVKTGKLYRHPSYLFPEYLRSVMAKDGTIQTSYWTGPPLENTMSRDHVLYFILYLASINNKILLHDFAKKMKWKISKQYAYTIDSWAWVKYVCYNKNKIHFNRLNKKEALKAFLYRQLYYWVSVPTMFLNVVWNKSISFIGGFKEVSQDNWVKGGFKKLPKYKKVLAKMLYPTYALHQKAWQLQAMKTNTLGYFLLNRLCRLITPKHNYLIQLLLGKNVTHYNVTSYKPMNGYRWSCNLDDTNDRDMDIIPYTVNNIDKDLLTKLYECKLHKNG